MPMTRGHIKAVKALAKELVEMCDKALARLDYEKTGQSDSDISGGSRETGALRRRSMDLTRALADMRRPYKWD